MPSIIQNLRDTGTMTGRIIKHSLRSADTITTVIVMPVFIMAMFVYIFGKSINTGGIDYVNYVVPGIVLMCIANGAAYAALRLNNDVTKGIINRFRTMPIARSAVLSGHVISSTLFNIVSAVIVFGVAALMGFRSDASIGSWLLAGGLLFLTALSMSWLSMIFGLIAKGAEGASAFSYVLLLFIFLSSAFAPIDGMHEFIRVIAEHQPITPILDTLRSLLTKNTLGDQAFAAVLWCTGMLVVSFITATSIYKHKTIK
ncbi:ABC transporter permease [Streptomyces caniscabiei]|uniref:ABC transporter permease n=1 Tax=Streptomyces caniscabiei TaxID=2746961 RepID=UPI0029B1B626|nr:ABC transporter permease [Streptomyces caniscabiei]MDX2775976.1 ABC transporter permease [Streptomyces caniscabiei]